MATGQHTPTAHLLSFPQQPPPGSQVAPTVTAKQHLPVQPYLPLQRCARDAELARHLPAGTFGRYVALRLRLTEQPGIFLKGFLRHFLRFLAFFNLFSIFLKKILFFSRPDGRPGIEWGPKSKKKTDKKIPYF